MLTLDKAIAFVEREQGQAYHGYYQLPGDGKPEGYNYQV